MNEETVSFKLAEPSDSKGVLKLMKKLVTESDTFTVDPELGNLTVSQEQRQIMLINQTRGNVILLAQLGSSFVGVVTVQRIGDSSYGELGVAVLKQFWNHGLGTVLVQEALNWGEEFSNLSALALTVEKTNVPAIKIYRKCGFRENHRKRMINVSGNTRSTSEMIYQLKK